MEGLWVEKLSEYVEAFRRSLGMQKPDVEVTEPTLYALRLDGQSKMFSLDIKSNQIELPVGVVNKFSVFPPFSLLTFTIICLPIYFRLLARL